MFLSPLKNLTPSLSFAILKAIFNFWDKDHLFAAAWSYPHVNDMFSILESAVYMLYAFCPRVANNCKTVNMFLSTICEYPAVATNLMNSNMLFTVIFLLDAAYLLLLSENV